MKYAIGIDLGATTAKTGIITNTGKIVDYSLMASNTTDDEHLFINSLSDTKPLFVENRTSIEAVSSVSV